jgi:NADH dehydrogenase
VPGVCPAAIQEGRYVARQIQRRLRGAPLEPFRYLDKGSFATLGRGAAVGQMWGGLKLSGFAAWIAWLSIHIFFLIGFRNRVLVLFQWAYSYLTFRRGARLITGGPRPAPPLA